MTTTLRKVYLASAGATGEDEEFALENHLAINGFRDVPRLALAKDYHDVFKIVDRVLGTCVLWSLVVSGCKSTASA
jgi:hypothetical protein